MEEKLKGHLFKLATMMAALGKTEEQIGWAAVRNYTFYKKIREGSGFTVRSYDRALRWFSDNWPEDWTWPKEIERPAPTSQETAEHGE